MKFNLTYYQGLSWLDSFHFDYLMFFAFPHPLSFFSLTFSPHPPLSDFFFFFFFFLRSDEVIKASALKVDDFRKNFSCARGSARTERTIKKYEVQSLLKEFIMYLDR